MVPERQSLAQGSLSNDISCLFSDMFVKDNSDELSNSQPTNIRSSVITKPFWSKNMAPLPDPWTDAPSLMYGDNLNYGADLVHRASLYWVSPVQRLPWEILGDIFVLCLPEEYHPDPTQAPLLLCQICSTWRAIAFGHSKLWDRLSLSFRFSDAYFATAYMNAASLMNVWFEHAKGIPVSFILKYWAPVMYCRGARLLESSIVLFSNSFRNLDLLDIRSKSDLLSFFTLPNGYVEQLESLVLDVGSMHDDADRQITVFRRAPRLRKVVLCVDRDWFEGIECRMLLPWSQLTHLKINTCLPFTTWLALFRQCTFLEHGEFFIDFAHRPSDDVDLDDIESVIYPNLTSLKLITAYTTPLRYSFDNLVFPALSSLEMHYTLIDTSWMRGFYEPLRLDSIRRLTLQRNTISIHDLLILLYASPFLTELDMWLDAISCPEYHLLLDLLKFTKGRDTPEHLLRGLEVLRIQVRSLATDSFPFDFANVVKSRWWKDAPVPPPVARLRYVSLHFRNQRVVDEVKALLEPCQREGLQLDIGVEREVVKTLSIL